MKITKGNGTTEDGTGIDIELSGNEVAGAIIKYLERNDIFITGPRSVFVNDVLCERGSVYVDPSGTVERNDKIISGRDGSVKSEDGRRLLRNCIKGDILIARNGEIFVFISHCHSIDDRFGVICAVQRDGEYVYNEADVVSYCNYDDNNIIAIIPYNGQLYTNFLEAYVQDIDVDSYLYEFGQSSGGVDLSVCTTGDVLVDRNGDVYLYQYAYTGRDDDGFYGTTYKVLKVLTGPGYYVGSMSEYEIRTAHGLVLEGMDNPRDIIATVPLMVAYNIFKDYYYANN